MEKMNMDEFAPKVCSAVSQKLGDGYKVEVEEIKKNNGVVLHGMTISTKSQNVAPTIFLEPFWEDYEKGISFTDLIHRLLAIYHQRDVHAKNIEIDFLRSFPKVKDRICYHLIGRKENEDLLDEIPHTEFFDLAICFYYAYQDATLGEGTIRIHNSHLKMWNTSTAELLRLAQDNTPRLFPWVCRPIGGVIRKMEENKEEGENGKPQKDIFRKTPMKILGNQKRILGAACILYPGVLEEIAEKEGSFYIIPRTIHEVILLPDDGKVPAEELKKKIHEVNTTKLAPEEVLSDSLYYYDSVKKEVVII